MLTSLTDRDEACEFPPMQGIQPSSSERIWRGVGGHQRKGLHACFEVSVVRSRKEGVGGSEVNWVVAIGHNLHLLSERKYFCRMCKRIDCAHV